MKITKTLLLFGLLIGFVSSCFDPPELPNTPEIDFKEIYFCEVGNASVADSLVLVLSFKDGDGDLGLGDEHQSEPFHEHSYKIEDGKLVTVRNSRKPGSTYPPFVKPFNCLNYLYDTLFIGESQKSLIDASYNIIDTTGPSSNRVYHVLDTFYIEKNPNHYNITVQFLEKINNDEFREFDWRTIFPYPNCGETFDGRFPVLTQEGRTTPLEGDLTYAMKSAGFIPLFGGKTLKLRIQIKDRALNLSNEIETEPFTLEKIKRCRR